MADVQQALAQSFGTMGLKVRSASQVLEKLQADGYVATVADGFLAVSQTGTQMNLPTLLQSYFKKHPADFVGHSGEIKYKSDLGDDSEAKSKIIADKGYAFWAALPATPNSPTAKDVLKPVVASTQMKRSEWLQLTPAEKSDAISSWGSSALRTVEEIQARR